MCVADDRRQSWKMSDFGYFRDVAPGRCPGPHEGLSAPRPGPGRGPGRL